MIDQNVYTQIFGQSFSLIKNRDGYFNCYLETILTQLLS